VGKEEVMLSWYQKVWRFVSRAASPASRDPASQRRRVRPKVEALEQRWVPAFTSEHLLPNESFGKGDLIFSAVQLSDTSVLNAMQLRGTSRGTLTYRDSKGNLVPVPVTVVLLDSNNGGHVHVFARKRFRFHTKEDTKEHMDVKIPNVRDLIHINVDISLLCPLQRGSFGGMGGGVCGFGGMGGGLGGFGGGNFGGIGGFGGVGGGLGGFG
jgi:hypothetical protein